ncbi:MAG: hypothetical protein ACRC2R_03855 [Xenococcaceae cyanobacterium]
MVSNRECSSKIKAIANCFSLFLIIQITRSLKNCASDRHLPLDRSREVGAIGRKKLDFFLLEVKRSASIVLQIVFKM